MRTASLVLAVCWLLSIGTALEAQTSYAGSSTVTAGTDSLANGDALVSTLASLPAGLGPSTPWLVQLEAGEYDLGSRQLALPGYVDLAGAGRGQTVVRSNVAGTTSASGLIHLPQGSVNELRDLSVANVVPFDDGIGIQTASDGTRLTRIEVGSAGIFLPVGVRLAGGSPVLTDVTIRALSTGGGAAFGFRGLEIAGGSPTVDGLTVTSTPLEASSPEAVYASAGTPLVENLAIQIAGDGIASGVIATGTTDITVVGASLDVSSAWEAHGVTVAGLASGSFDDIQVAAISDGQAVALATADSGWATVTGDSVLGGLGQGNSYGLCNRAITSVDATLVAGGRAAIWSDDPAATASVSDSQLDGGVLVSSGTVSCSGSSDVQGNPLGPSCL